MTGTRRPVRRRSYVLVYAFIAFFFLLAHIALLQVPYYWDEVGQFIPASLDLYQTGSWVAHSTLPNVHPPGVMAYLALFWRIFGYSIVATRIAMILVAALGILFTFLLAIELGRGSPGAPAFTAVAILCVSPLFFAQAMLAQLDMPAMSLTVLALLLFLQNRFRASAFACVALVLIKETGIALPALLGCWLLAERRVRQALWYLLPPTALCVWLVVLKRATGHWFGNQGFTEYNIFYPLNPVRFSLALARRFYYLFVGSGNFIGAAAFLRAFRRMPLFRDRAWRVAGSFVAFHVLLVSAFGGAVLERYLLPAMPVVFIAFAISLRALLPRARYFAVSALILFLAAANFINPLYPFPFENNLAFASFVELEQEAAAAVAVRSGTVATTFPMGDSLRRPEFGYILRRPPIVQMQDFRAADIAKLETNRPDMMIVYDTAWDPLHLFRSASVQGILRTWYGYEPPMSPDAIAGVLSMRVSRRWNRRGLSMALLVRGNRTPEMHSALR